MKFHKLLIAALILTATILAGSAGAQWQIDSSRAQEMGKRDHVTNTDSLTLNAVRIAPGAITATSVYVMNHPDSVKTYETINSVGWKDTLGVDSTTRTYNFGRQYPHVWVSLMYDSAAAGNDTLRIYQIGSGGDTTDVYVLDSANNRVGYILNTGDMKYKKVRLDVLCPNILIFQYSDAIIYTTKFIIIPEGVKH